MIGTTPMPNAMTCAPPAPHCLPRAIGPLTAAWDTGGPLPHISEEP
jgi:hypothetical protein